MWQRGRSKHFSKIITIKKHIEKWVSLVWALATLLSSLGQSYTVFLCGVYVRTIFHTLYTCLSPNPWSSGLQYDLTTKQQQKICNSNITVYAWENCTDKHAEQLCMHLMRMLLVFQMWVLSKFSVLLGFLPLPWSIRWTHGQAICRILRFWSFSMARSFYNA